MSREERWPDLGRLLVGPRPTRGIRVRKCQRDLQAALVGEHREGREAAERETCEAGLEAPPDRLRAFLDA